VRKEIEARSRELRVPSFVLIKFSEIEKLLLKLPYFSTLNNDAKQALVEVTAWKA
jgi:hypothetical protein